MLKGSVYPDQWVVRGNHHDGWVFGSSDPLAGQSAMLEEAKALGAMRKTGWKPKRSIVYTSWDGEEPMLLGSTEWAETHADELQKKSRALHQQRRQQPRRSQCRRQRGSGEIRRPG